MPKMSTPPSDNFVWASDALQNIKEGRAKGNRLALRIRSRLQDALYHIGCASQKHCGKVVLFSLVIISVLTFGLTRAKLETNAEKLWVEVGGRLEKELAYTKASLGEEFGATLELLIQTPNIGGTNILNAEALLQHLKALKKATQVKVTVHNKEWTLKDLCFSPNLPDIDNKFVRPLLNHLIPCAIITPLDCFWEGAKIHGPEQNITLLPIIKKNIKWTSLNPITLLEKFKNVLPQREIDKMIMMFKEAGISTGYINKPCLNPHDPDCPVTAPNFKSKERPDIGAVLTGGCHGFATKYMEWPEELIVGGVTKNRSGTIRSAAALQSVIILLSAQNMQEYYQDDSGRDRTIENTKEILAEWQREYTKVMNSMSSNEKEEYSILAFTSTSFNDLLKDFSKSSTFRLAIGYVLMVIYSCLTLKRWNDAVQSHGGLGIAGVLLVTLAVVSGLGFCSFCDIPFNAASTQVLPFLMLGLGVDDMFLIAHTYASMYEVDPSVQVAYSLSSTGVSVLLTSFNNMFAFFMAAMIPIPALRAFSIQAAVIVVFNYLAVIIVFPAMIAIDVKRKQDQRYDLLCCCQRTVPRRISITPDSSTDTGMILRRYHNSCSSLSSMSAAAVQAPGLGAVVTANGTISLPGTVTVRASAIAELGTCTTTVYNTMVPLSVAGLSSDVDDRGTIAAGANLEGRSKLSAANFHMIGKTTCYNASGRDPGDTVPNRDLGISRQTTGTVTSIDRGRKHMSKHQSTSSVVICGGGNVRTDDCRNAIDINKHSRETNGHSQTGSRLSGSPAASAHLSSRNTNAFMEETNSNKWEKLKEKLSMTYFAKYCYGPWLQKNSTKIFVLFLFAALFGAGAYGCMLVHDGLDLTDVVPRNSTEHKFVMAQSKYFSFYTMYAITKKDYDYPNGQKLLYKYHEAFKRVTNVVKTPELEVQPFWLLYFRDWLKDMQKAFDADWTSGCITYSGWRDNASDSGIMGYKMLAQTGIKDNPINKSQVRSVRLVDKSGIIRPQTFYNYLTVWSNMDTMGYTASEVNIRPKATNWFNLRDVTEAQSMRMEAAQPIEFAQLPFYLINLRQTEDFVKTIKEVRKICDEFTEAGLPTYPYGIPFTFWEQYIWLRQHLLIAIMIILSVSFLVMAAVLCNVWVAIIIVITLIMITVQVFGFMGLAGIKLSAVPAVTLILSVGVGVEFTVHMCMAFLTATGDRNRRMQKAVELVFAPIVDGAISTLLGVAMLAGSEFDFIVRYFFHLLAALIVIGSLNGLLFLPILLSLVGPAPEVEDVRPPGTASSAGSQRELLPSSSCRRGTPPTDSQLCILEATGYHENRHDDCMGAENSQRSNKKHRSDRRSRRSRFHDPYNTGTPPRIVDSESSSSTVTRVTATATVTVELHTEQFPTERTLKGRVHDSMQPGNRRVQPARDSGHNGGDCEVVDLELEGHSEVR